MGTFWVETPKVVYIFISTGSQNCCALALQGCLARTLPHVAMGGKDLLLHSHIRLRYEAHWGIPAVKVQCHQNGSRIPPMSSATVRQVVQVLHPPVWGTGNVCTGSQAECCSVVFQQLRQ